MISIRSALLTAVAVTFVPFLAAGGFLLWHQSSERERQISELLLTQSSGLARSLDAQIAKAGEALAGLSATRYVDEQDFASLHAAARRLAAEHPDLLSIGLFRPDGQQVLNTRRPFGAPLPNPFSESVQRAPAPAFEDLPLTSTGWLRQAFSHGAPTPLLSDVFYGLVAAGPVASLHVPVMRDGRVVYVWTWSFDLGRLQAFVRGQIRDPDTLVAVVDRNGVIVARDASRSDLIGKPASQTIRAFASGGAPEDVRPGRTLEGVRVYTAYSRTSQGWTVAIARPYQDVQAAIGAAGFWWGLSVVGSSLVAVLFVLWLTREISVPLARLALAAPVVQEGRAPKVETRIREVASLGEALSEAARNRQIAVRLALLEGLVQHAPVAVALFDHDLRVVLLNERAAAVSGAPVQAHAGKTLPQVIGSFGEQVEPVLRKVRDSGLPVSLREIAGETPGQPGKRRWWIAEYFPLKDGEGRVTHVGAVALEITDRKDAEERLREADERKDVYLATLAHELRNPLAPIRNAVAILRHGAPADPTLAWARDVIDRQAAQMARLLDDLLEVSRIARGKMELRKSIFDLRDAIQDALETSRPILAGRRHAEEVDLGPVPLWIDADRVRLAEVFVNLVTNAAKYMNPGGRIRIEAGVENAEAVVRVRDEGIGIEPELLERIFEPFAQSTKTLHRADGGLGIGLALVKGIVALHGGSVAAQSAGTDRGATFVVRMPLSGAPAKPHAAEAAGHTQLAHGFRVVVVDDNRDSADSLARLLQSAGACVSVGYDGETALALIERESPDAVVLDIGMPGMSGYDVARAVSGMRRKPFLIAITGWGQESDRQAAMEAGFNRHFTKPVDPAELLQMLASLPGRATVA